jgi:small subunit ribosomal protein S1
LELALAGGTPVTGTVTASNKGGFNVDVAGIRAFCPISQIDLSYVRDPEIYVGQTLDFQVMEIKEGGRNVVVSRRKLLQDERRQAESELMSRLAPGALVTGTIKSTVRSGAIVDLGGVEGFIPISELARARVELAEDVVSIGETVQAQVLSVEQNDKGLSIRLSLKALAAPLAEKQVEKDEILVGKVIKHVPAGVIVSTEKGEGLVPTRELSLPPGADHRRMYALDTELRVVVVSRDPTSGKLRFSVGRVAEVEERNNYREFGKADASKSNASMGSLGELMSKKFPKLAAQAKSAPAEAPKSAASPSPQPAHKVQPTASPQAQQKNHEGVRRRNK